DGAAIPTSDTVPSEVVISYDKNNPPMDVGTIYPTMEEFNKLASLLGEGNSSQSAAASSHENMLTAAAPKKMTPKRRLHVG
ncbi:hypothetical protein PVAP13_3KG542301, partial [Panicum virgatum]